MKSFLLKNNTPTIKWSLLPDNIFFEGNVPEGYDLAICPGKYTILDIDNKNGKCGYAHIPKELEQELWNTLNYKTKSGGAHVWMLYTGNKILKNTSTKYGLDLRIGETKNNAGGYVKYHYSGDIREHEYLIKETSANLNGWLEKLFS